MKIWTFMILNITSMDLKITDHILGTSIAYNNGNLKLLVVVILNDLSFYLKGFREKSHIL